MKIVNDTIGNPNRDFLTFSAVPQPTACPVLLSIIYDITAVETTVDSFITITGNKSSPWLGACNSGERNAVNVCNG